MPFASRQHAVIKDGAAGRPSTATVGGETGTMAYDASLAIPESVWKGMGPSAQAAAARCAAARAELRKVGVLSFDGTSLSETEATMFKVEVLHKANDVVQLGLFHIPAIDNAICVGPKGLGLGRAQQLFLQSQRLAVAQEFVQALRDAKREKPNEPFGVLLSGPNGVGKSLAAVQAFLSSFAQGLIVVYIPNAMEWVIAAQEGLGHEYFLKHLLAQNADLIAADPVLREALLPALRDQVLDAAVMRALYTALEREGCPGVGVIVDEVQKITEALAIGRQPGATLAKREALDYFGQWENWQTSTHRFTRLDVASSHGMRELKLPSSEDIRLRIIKPWEPLVTAAAASNAHSPFYIADDAARERIIFVAGGIPRSIDRGRSLWLEKLAVLPSAVALDTVEVALTLPMTECMVRWFEALDEKHKDDAAHLMLDLVRGQVTWEPVKPLYDNGLVARHDETYYVRPVSSVAASIIFQVLAPHVRKRRRALKSILDAELRAYELEQQIKAALLLGSVAPLSTKTFDGQPGISVHVPAQRPVSFETITANRKLRVVEHPTHAQLYMPSDKQYPCDAITMPSASDNISPIIVWETSVTDPRDGKRVLKCLKWFGIRPPKAKADDGDGGTSATKPTADDGDGGTSATKPKDDDGDGGTSATKPKADDGDGGTSATKPKADDGDGGTSATKPKAADRDSDVILRLRKAHPSRSIVCVLCWDRSFVADGTSVHTKLTFAAAKKTADDKGAYKGSGQAPTVTVVVADQVFLQQLGVLA